MCALYLLVSFPLTVIGAIAGRNMSGDFEAPCRTTKAPREVPKDVPWYRQQFFQMFMVSQGPALRGVMQGIALFEIVVTTASVTDPPCVALFVRRACACVRILNRNP